MTAADHAFAVFIHDLSANPYRVSALLRERMTTTTERNAAHG